MKTADLFTKQRNISRRGLSQQYENTDACFSFYNGDQMTYQDRIQFLEPTGNRKRALVQFNKVQPNVDAVVGFMAQNRRQAKFIAHLNASEDQQIYSKNMNSLYSFHRENQNADQVETDQDADMMICGYGATETDLSYVVGNATTDPNGEIIKVRLTPKQVYWDPHARGKNLLDARWAGYFEDYELKEALDLFQGSDKEDFQTVNEEDPSDTGYMFNPWGGLYDKIKLNDSVEWAAKEQDMVRVYNHQWFTYETFYRAENPLYLEDDLDTALYMRARLEGIFADVELNGPDDMGVKDMFTFDPTAEQLVFDEATKRKLVKEFGELITPVGFKRKVFHTAVISGTHVFSEFRSISQQGYSIKFKTGIYNEQNMIWVGMVNPMMEPAKYHNKALTELMFTIAANSKGGVMVEEGAVEDITDFESKWAKTDAVIKVNTGAISGGMIMQKTQGALPTGLENIITLSAAAISDAGVDPAFLGNVDKEDQSGILYKRRIRQIISKMARYFDSITLYQKEDARLHLDLIPVWVENNNGQWINITGEEGADAFVQVTEDMLAPEYDVSIQEAPQTPEDKQETAMLLSTFGDKMAMTNPAAANAFYAKSVSMLSLDGDDKNELIQALQPQESVPLQQFQQLQQELEQLKSAMNQAQVEKLNSETAKNIATVEKTRADIPKVQADTVKTLEDASRIAKETDLITSGKFQDANVNI
jgi:hypothetical protein